MASTISPSKKCCATCQHWKGERKIVFGGKSIQIGTAAPCAMQPNDTPPHWRSPAVICPKYKEWVDLP
ncbi:MAG: hypothetical protein IJJ33_09665 [Victivallales bacterium]|nr:hypothetical protein [Victivallales bacterium]MBQ6472240.1 hypothetical protein [Victivallales bacterium]